MLGRHYGHLEEDGQDEAASDAQVALGFEDSNAKVTIFSDSHFS